MSSPHLLVVGCGSVGKRHIRNFIDLGCSVSAVDSRPDRVIEARQVAPLAGTFNDFRSGLTAAVPLSGIIIATPTSFHVDQAVAALERGVAVYLEKPIAMGTADAERLRRAAASTSSPILVGYTWRWWPAVQEMRALVDAGAIGEPLHARSVMGANLADWHPWEPYQDFFMSRSSLGGGALLDESHVIDLMLWMFGVPDALSASIRKVSALEVDTDDNVDSVWLYEHSLTLTIHLDLYARPHERSITIVGSEGTLQWTFDPNRLRLSKATSEDWSDRNFAGERNDMFVSAAKEFLDVIGGDASPSCTLDDGYRVMLLIDAMRESAASGRMVTPADRQ